MYNDRHKMPHIHVYYAEDEAVFDLTGEIIAGDFPKKQAAYVKAWCLLHEEELSANWKLAVIANTFSSVPSERLTPSSL